MPFAIGIPSGGTLRLTSYCCPDLFGERSEVPIFGKIDVGFAKPSNDESAKTRLHFDPDL
jgi:hypothetical protein